MGLLWTSDQLVAEAATYTAQNTQMRINFLPSSLRILIRDPSSRAAIELHLITALPVGSIACSISKYKGAEKSLARHDWKNNWKLAIFRPTRRSLLPRRPGWTDNVLNFFWIACKSLVAVAFFLPGLAKDVLALLVVGLREVKICHESFILIAVISYS